MEELSVATPVKACVVPEGIVTSDAGDEMLAVTVFVPPPLPVVTLSAKSSTTKEVWLAASSVPTRFTWIVCPL